MFDNIIGKYTQSDMRCGHVADVGYVCPFIYTEGDITIKPFSECNKSIKEEISIHILNEWGKEIGVKDKKGIIEFIERHWSSTDVFYIMLKHETNTLIGCIGIDRSQFYPYISHLYVIDKHRKNGYSLKLMKFAEKIIKDMSFTESRLWCIERLTDYYKNQGYVVENKVNKSGVENFIMVKNL